MTAALEVRPPWPPPDKEKGRETESPRPWKYRLDEKRQTQDSASPATAQAPVIPEYGCSRRRFLIYAVMCGYAPPERAVERIVAELEEDASP